MTTASKDTFHICDNLNKGVTVKDDLPWQISAAGISAEMAISKSD